MKLRAVGLTESAFFFPAPSRDGAPIHVLVGDGGVLKVHESRKSKEKDMDGNPRYEKVLVDLPDDVAEDLLANTSLGQFVIREHEEPEAADEK